MGENTLIAWADHTFNPWIGCTKVGPGCDHCYAEELDRNRFSYMFSKVDPVQRLRIPITHWGPGAPRHRTSRSTWQLPRRWNRRAKETGETQRVFCASLADVFDNEVPEEWRADLWKLIDETPALTWMLLTKRIGNVERMVPPKWLDHASFDWPYNVWLGITVVTQEEADRDIPKLLQLNPSIAWLSIEPQLEEIDLRRYLVPWNHRDRRYGNRVDWVISGGESGANARPYNPEWSLSLIDQCRRTGVPMFMKQFGSLIGLKDRAGADPSEWLEDYRVREFPRRGQP